MRIGYTDRIGIMGAQGVGKTTLLNALRNEKVYKDYTFCDEVTRWVKQFGFQINEDGNDKTQELIAMKHVYNIRMNPYMITDRTILDCLVYTRFLYNKNQVSLGCLQLVKKIFDEMYYDYDMLYYIKPEFDIEDDGVRSTDVGFRDEIQELFEQALFEDLNPTDYKVISGSVEDRVKQIKDIVLYQ